MHNYSCFIVIGCPPGFTYLADANGCFKLVLEAMNFTDSQAICPQVNPLSHLVVINSSAQNNAVVQYLQSFSSTGKLKI